MARAETRTILPLDRFAKIIGISPLMFNQVELNEDDPTGRAAMQPPTTCDMPFVQHSWQQGAGGCVGREEIARAIADAESMITHWCGFTPGVTWFKDDNVDFPRPFNRLGFNHWGMDVRGFPNVVKTNFGYVQMGGIEAKSQIQSGAVLTYIDNDGDGYAEIANVLVPLLPEVQEDEVAVYYPGHNADDAWEIRPIKVEMDIDGQNTCSITFRREQAVTEEILEAFVAQAADGMNDADFLTDVDIYRHYNDPSQQATLIWQAPGGCGACGSVGCSVCLTQQQPGCLNVRESRVGLVALQPGDWNVSTGLFNPTFFAECRAPDRVKLNYRAGRIDSRLHNPMIEMSAFWERAVSYYALSFMDRPLCTCENIRAKTAHWSEDLYTSSATTSGGSHVSRMAMGLLDNPLGTTRGAIFAWRLVQRERLGEAVNA